MKTILTLFAFLIFPFSVFSQTVEISETEHTGTRMIRVTVSWTADASGDATADFDVLLAELLAGRVCTNARTIPGSSTPPTDDYDITVSTAGGLSVFGDRLDDRDATTEEIASPLVSSVADNITSVFPYSFDGALDGEIWTFTVSGAGNGGQGTLILFFR
jgi:hypothetical protein